MIVARNQELDGVLIEEFRKKVKTGGFPAAVLLTDGYTFWVESWKHGFYGGTPMIISLKSKTPLEAWMSCRDYLAAR